jgi:hypothetical protein
VPSSAVHDLVHAAAIKMDAIVACDFIEDRAHFFVGILSEEVGHFEVCC